MAKKPMIYTQKGYQELVDELHYLKQFIKRLLKRDH